MIDQITDWYIDDFEFTAQGREKLLTHLERNNFYLFVLFNYFPHQCHHNLILVTDYLEASHLLVFRDGTYRSAFYIESSDFVFKSIK